MDYVDTIPKGGGWLILEIHANSRKKFNSILVMLKEKLPVIYYDRSVRKYCTSVFYLDDVEKVCDEFGIDLYCNKRSVKMQKLMMKKMERISKVDCKDFSTIYWAKQKNKQLYDYQKIAVNKCLYSIGTLLGGVPIGDEMGLGKTMEAIAITCKLFEYGYKRALLVVPNRLKYQWKSEILNFTKFDSYNISIVDSANIICPLDHDEKMDFKSKGSNCKQCSKCDRCKNLKVSPQLMRQEQLKRGRFVIINYEVLNKMKKDIIRNDFDIIVLDEATGKSGIKNSKTGAAKALFEIRKNLPSYTLVFPMSGTFIENKLEDIYGPFALINKRIMGEFYNFKNHYLIFDYFGQVVGYKDTERLKQLIDKWLIRRTAKEVWKDRPQLIESNRYCNMDKKQRKIYEDARDSKLEELKDLEIQDKINTASIGAMISYLLMICDTTKVLDDGFDYSIKLDHLEDIVTEEIGHNKKIVIFSFFAKKVIPHIIEKLKTLKSGKVLKIVGGMKSEKIEDIKKKFNKEKKYRFLVCSDAMAYGANLQSAQYVINFDLPWNPAILDQRIRRVYRKGQKNTVTVTNLVTVDTIEDRVLEVIGRKRKLFDEFIEGGLKKRKPTLKNLLNVLKQA